MKLSTVQHHLHSDLEQKENNRSYHLAYTEKLNITRSPIKKFPDQLARGNFKTENFKWINYFCRSSFSLLRYLLELSIFMTKSFTKHPNGQAYPRAAPRPHPSLSLSPPATVVLPLVIFHTGPTFLFYYLSGQNTWYCHKCQINPTIKFNLCLSS